jgi:hypothetical protein
MRRPSQMAMRKWQRTRSKEALGHNSKAGHRAYAKRVLMKIPSLEEHEREAAAKSV